MIYHTYTGKPINYQRPKENHYCIEDIAHHLSIENRYGGKTDRPYSVANHALFCVEIAKELGYSTTIQLQCLLHDASEAYLKDIPTPLKTELHGYRLVEYHFQQAISKQLGVGMFAEREVKRVDEIALKAEMQWFVPNEPIGYLNKIPDTLIAIPEFPPRTAERLFIQIFNQLKEPQNAKTN